MKRIAGYALLLLVFVGCSQQGTGPAYETGSRSSGDQSVYSSEHRETKSSRGLSSNRSSQLAFLNSIREADPRHQTIERALMNEQNELGIVLSRHVEMDDIPALMRSLLKQMAARFPGEDLTIVAYAPGDPPRTIGTARLDAQTREMTYTPSQRSRI